VIGVLEAINPISGHFRSGRLAGDDRTGRSLAGSTIQNGAIPGTPAAGASAITVNYFEDSVDPILITDWEGKILEANRRAVALEWLLPMNSFMPMNIGQLDNIKHRQDRSELRDYEAVRSSPAMSSVLNLQNGGTMPVEVHARRVEFEETDCVQWICARYHRAQGTRCTA